MSHPAKARVASREDVAKLAKKLRCQHKARNYIACCFGCYRCLKVSLDAVGGIEAVMVLTLIFLKWRALN